MNKNLIDELKNIKEIYTLTPEEVKKFVEDFIYGLKNNATILEIVGRVISPIFGFFMGSSLYLYLCN